MHDFDLIDTRRNLDQYHSLRLMVNGETLRNIRWGYLSGLRRLSILLAALIKPEYTHRLCDTVNNTNI